jgi:hypothetical protein
MTTYYADDGWLEPECAGCGKAAAVGEEIQVIQASSSEGIWMHVPCAQAYLEWCEKEHENFYANKVMKFVRGEASGITPGTAGETEAKIAKDLIAKTPSLARPENWRDLRAAVEAIERKHNSVTLSDEEIATCERWARDRAASLRKARRRG